MDRREINIQIFRDTEQRCKSDEKLIDVIKKSNQRQYIVNESEMLPAMNQHRYSEPVEVIVSKKRSLEAAAGYPENKVCVHNFASATNPGGGVTKGSNAQEEAICRCSTLYFNINEPSIVKKFHDKHRSDIKADKMNVLYNDDCIFTPDVCVFKSDTVTPELLPVQEWYQIDVITCAAPNLRERPSNSMNPDSGSNSVRIKDNDLLNLHIKRMSRICELAIKEQDEVLILGAFGCGAFCNDPYVVAEAMKKIVEKYKFDFKVIEFAVYCSSWDTKNYEVFSKRLER